MGQGNGRVVCGADFIEMSRGAENKFKTAVGKIEFLQLDLRIGFFFRLLVLRDFFAETARVLAVERALEGAW